MWVKILAFIFLFFFAAYISKADTNIRTIPFHDFDEAHRAENAKRMKEYFSLLVPLTGSPADRSPELRVPLRENPNLFLYYHPERPPFVYWLMILSTSAFGDSEWAYRLPSLLMSLATVLVFIFFAAFFSKTLNIIAFSTGLLVLITSADLWLSGQYAQLDTSLTFFLFAALLTLILYCIEKKNAYIVFSGISFSLAVLSKGQPAIILIPPLLFLWINKKLNRKDILKFLTSAAIILLPWLFLLEIYFGFLKVLAIFTSFAASSALVEYSYIKAPFFWYLRWWWDTFRPGFALFLALFAFDILRKNIEWKRMAILSYIFGGLLIFSLSVNKIWWYVLPLVPAVTFYIYLSSKEYLDNHKSGVINISLIIILASLPLFYEKTNTTALIYGICISTISIFILLIRFFGLRPQNDRLRKILYCISVVTSLIFFYRNFPEIVPYHRNTKPVTEYYKSLPGQKCLWIKDMPPETALFYSNAGEVITLTENTKLLPDCANYLITPSDYITDNLKYSLNSEVYYLKDRRIIFQKGNMKLIKLQEP